MGSQIEENVAVWDDFQTIVIVDKIIHIKWVAPFAQKILGHEKFGPPLKKLLDRKILSYLICGLVTTILAYWAFDFFIGLGFEVVPSNIISAVAAVLFAFVINKQFVFLSKDWSLRVAFKELAQFAGGRAVVTAVETGLLKLLVDIMHLNANICKLSTLIMVVVVNYIISKFIF